MNNRVYATSFITLRKLQKAVDAMRLLDPTMPLQTLTAFLLIAFEEGQSITQIGNKIGISQSSTSRNISSLSSWSWKKTKGLELIEYRQDPMNLAVKNVYLTNKGKRLAEIMAGSLKENE